MTWTKLSDDYADDCDGLSDAAFRLHTEALVWSNRKLLDCRLPKERLERFTSRPEAATELVNAGWWSDEGTTYVIRHHALYQRTREDVLRQQEANRNNGRLGGRPRRPAREQALTSETQSVSDSASHSTTQRDGTGRDRPAVTEAPSATESERRSWPPTRAVGGAA